ncbi:MAG: hypothetical protein HC905_13775 [Bacteroidales bacterium]|nr:hypothetical protein [Bacteroidales bacterium]
MKTNLVDALVHHLHDQMKPTNEYYIIQAGIRYLCHIFQYVNDYLSRFTLSAIPDYLSHLFFIVQEILKRPEISYTLSFKGNDFLNPWQIARYDHFLRTTAKDDIRKLLDFVYEVDALEAIARAKSMYNLSYPEYLDTETPFVCLQSVFHPLLSQPVANHFELGIETNLCFSLVRICPVNQPF